jgi:hypothetical protein
VSDEVEIPTGRIRFDVVFGRCALALMLSGVSLVLVLLEAKLSLLPLVAGFGLVTHGSQIKNRYEPPMTFLLMVPVIVAIVVSLIRQSG